MQQLNRAGSFWRGLLIGVLPLAFGCDSDSHDDESSECGPHGHLHGGAGVEPHCHCDDGYEDVDGTCVESGTETGHIDEGELTRGRLVVSSASLPEAYVLDLDTLGLTTVAAGAAGAYVNGGPESSLGWLVHYETGLVEVVHSGTSIALHEGHFHVTKTDAQRLGFSLMGDHPAHVVGHDGLTAVFFDGLGETRLVSETALLAGTAVVPQVVTTNMPHHGVAVPLHDHLLITVGQEGTEADAAEGWGTTIPVGVVARDFHAPETIVHTSAACTKLHGEAAQEHYVAFACDEGVLLFTVDGAAITSSVLPWPAGAVGRAWGMKTLETSPFFAGDFGPALVYIDPATKLVQTGTLPDGVGQKAFAFDEDGIHLLVLGEDGQLRRVSLPGFAVVGLPLAVAQPFLDPADVAGVYQAAGRAYVLDRRTAAVVTVDLDAWTVHGAAVQLPSPPFAATVLSVSPDWE